MRKEMCNTKHMHVEILHTGFSGPLKGKVAEGSTGSHLKNLSHVCRWRGITFVPSPFLLSIRHLCARPVSFVYLFIQPVESTRPTCIMKFMNTPGRRAGGATAGNPSRRISKHGDPGARGIVTPTASWCTHVCVVCRGTGVTRRQIWFIACAAYNNYYITAEGRCSKR